DRSCRASLIRVVVTTTMPTPCAGCCACCLRRSCRLCVPKTRVKTHKLEMSLWFAAFRILLPDALTQNLRVASDTYTFVSLDPRFCNTGDATRQAAHAM